MKSIVVYTDNNRACISDRTTNKYLPNSMSAWQEEVLWDFRLGYPTLVMLCYRNKFLLLCSSLKFFDISVVVNRNYSIVTLH